MAEKLVLAYSGGLDTSVAIRWLQEKYNVDVITLTADLGKLDDMDEIKQRALDTKAIAAEVRDGRDEFLKDFVWPALQANALYQGVYPLATALGRPLIAKMLVEVARLHGATMVAHGCTGKGNDQVRLDVGIAALGPDLKVLAPAREWGMTRDEEIAYAQKNDISVFNANKQFSTDENLWGRSIEAGPLENPWSEPPEEAYLWTKAVADTPDASEYTEIDFDKGLPIAIDGTKLDPIQIVNLISERAGNHGIGRIDHIEDRLVGIKSREVYEAPAAAVLIPAHQALEAMTLTREQLRFKEHVSRDYADLTYNGLWYSSHRNDLQAYIKSTQTHVSGTVRVKLYKAKATVVGVRSPNALYQHDLATYGDGDLFDQSASPGFIHLWGLPNRVQAQIQGNSDQS